MSFEYSVEQLGLRNMEQTHRVYRAGPAERDETLVVDGYHLRAPTVRIIADRSNRYAIERVAPTLAAYAFSFEGAVNESDGYGYVFSTRPRGTTAYAVSEIELDGRSFLPRSIRFKLAGAAAHGSGSLTFGAAERYWVVLAADVSAHIPGGTVAHERITWSNYRFPSALPTSTFGSPHPSATPPPPLPLDATAPL